MLALVRDPTRYKAKLRMIRLSFQDDSCQYVTVTVLNPLNSRGSLGHCLNNDIELLRVLSCRTARKLIFAVISHGILHPYTHQLERHHLV